MEYRISQAGVYPVGFSMALPAGTSFQGYKIKVKGLIGRFTGRTPATMVPLGFT